MPIPTAQGLYDPSFEHDACGVAFVASIVGERSHAIVGRGLEALVNLGHRGACGCDPETGDGAGVLLQVPDAFLRGVAGVDLPPPGAYGVGMIFQPNDPDQRAHCEDIIARACVDEGVRLLAWRDVPAEPSAVGRVAREGMPAIRQFFVAAVALEGDTLERRLYVLRKVIERRVAEVDLPEGHLFYICSLSSRTLVYKGMLMAHQIERFYPELRDTSMKTFFEWFPDGIAGRYEATPKTFWMHTGAGSAPMEVMFRAMDDVGDIANVLLGFDDVSDASDPSHRPRHVVG